MDNYDRLSVLLQKRETVRERIDAFNEFLQQYDANNVGHTTQLQLRSQAVANSYATLDEIYDEIQIVDSDTDYTREKKSIENSYFEVIAKAQNFLVALMPAVNLNNQPSIASGENVNESVTSASRRRLKLPQAKLPTFSGKLEEWMSFRDTFNTMIHQRDDLTNVEKLQYLESVVTDEALCKIQVFSITDDNYERAWDLLHKSYQNERALISRHLILLLRLPIQEKENYKGLITLADVSQQHVQSLISLGVNVSTEILVAIIEEKLNKTTLEKWEETVNREEYPKFETLIEFLYRTAARLSKRKIDQVYSSEQNNKTGPPAKRGKSDRQAFVTNINKPWVICQETHPLFKCSKFLQMSVNERFKIVKENYLCFNCLRDHKAKDCKSGTCKKCKKNHNTLLHFNKVAEQSEPKKD